MMKAKLKTLLIKAVIIFLPGLLYATNAISSVPDYGEDGEYASKETLLDIGNGFGQPLVVRYPEGKEGPAPTIIFLHGFGAGGVFIPFGDSVYRDMTEHFVSRGFNVIAPVVTADINLFLTAGVGYPIYANEVLWAGVQAGVGILAAKGRIDKSKMGVVGHSLGGGVAPFITKKIAQRGWGDDGLFMAQLAPWYSHLMKDNDLENLPGHTKHLGIVFSKDKQNSHRMAIDIHHHLGINDLEKDFLIYEGCTKDSDGHLLPGAGLGGANKDDVFLWRHLDALAHYSFEGPYASAGFENAREVSLGVSPAGGINRIPQYGEGAADSECVGIGTDTPLADGFGSDDTEDQFDLSKWDGTLNFLGTPLVTPFPAGPFLNVRWHIWDDYYEDGINRGSVLHYFSYLLKFWGVAPHLANVLENIGDHFFSFSNINGSPITVFQSNIGVDLPKVVIIPKICGPKYKVWVWTGPWPWSGKWVTRQDCIPEVSLGPVSFNPVSIKASLDDLSIGNISTGELVSPIPSESDLNNAEPYVQYLDFSMQDIELDLNIESNVLGINGLVESILDFLGLGQTLDALDGNFTSSIKLERMEMPIDFIISQDEFNGVHTTIIPGLTSSGFETKIDLPDVFNVFGFDLAQKVVDKITSKFDTARDFILEMVFENILSNLFMPALNELDVSNSVTIEPVQILQPLQQSCIRYETSMRWVRNGWWWSQQPVEECVEWGW